jgi:hypothetical protein
MPAKNVLSGRRRGGAPTARRPKRQPAVSGSRRKSPPPGRPSAVIPAVRVNPCRSYNSATTGSVSGASQSRPPPPRASPGTFSSNAPSPRRSVTRSPAPTATPFAHGGSLTRRGARRCGSGVTPQQNAGMPSAIIAGTSRTRSVPADRANPDESPMLSPSVVVPSGPHGIDAPRARWRLSSSCRTMQQRARREVDG